jgi:hypothetical protein
MLTRRDRVLIARCLRQRYRGLVQQPLRHPPDTADYARNQADIVWMQETFADAKTGRSAAITLTSA